MPASARALSQPWPLRGAPGGGLDPEPSVWTRLSARRIPGLGATQSVCNTLSRGPPPPLGLGATQSACNTLSRGPPPPLGLGATQSVCNTLSWGPPPPLGWGICGQHGLYPQGCKLPVKGQVVNIWGLCWSQMISVSHSLFVFLEGASAFLIL